MQPVNFSIQLFKGKTLGDGTHPIMAMTSVAGEVKRIGLPRILAGDHALRSPRPNGTMRTVA